VRRVPFIALLALLLLAMQLQEPLHALSHAGDRLHTQQEQGLQSPEPEEACPLCALFAGGSAAAVSDAAMAQPPRPAATVVTPARLARVGSTLTAYRSRAPPVLL
jgi:hypothetical protein